MREAEEAKQWKELRSSASRVPTRKVVVAGSELDVTDPAIILGGRNGAGKSRVLRALHDDPDESTVYIDLHHVCEQALTVLRSREDLDSMVEEYGELELSRERIDDLQRVIGRNYESVAWYALELEPSDSAAIESFLWGSDTSLVPYFRAKYHGVEYASPEMGLGELSMHMLFWILEQYRDVPGLTLLLDEPDAYLPPVGVKGLLHRILALCADRKWRVVLSTHSEEMISQAVAEKAFVYVRTDAGGSIVLEQSAGNPNVAESLLTRPAMSRVLFCEDESAFNLLRAILDRVDRRYMWGTTVVWTKGTGNLHTLKKVLPRPQRAEVSFGIIFDGDQRHLVKVRGAQSLGASGDVSAKRSDITWHSEDGWPFLFLPTSEDPDSLFMGVLQNLGYLAARLGRDTDELQRFLDAQEGGDAHDWVDKLGARYGRPQVLVALAEIWVEDNLDLAKEFTRGLRKCVP